MMKELFVPLINQIHHHLHHHILLFGTALGNHQREGYESIVSQTLGAVRTVKNTVVIHEP